MQNVNKFNSWSFELCICKEICRNDGTAQKFGIGMADIMDWYRVKSDIGMDRAPAHCIKQTNKNILYLLRNFLILSSQMLTFCLLSQILVKSYLFRLFENCFDKKKSKIFIRN